jgi:hypothetical protein
MRLSSTYAMLDVKYGRGRLRKALRVSPRQVPVVIHGFIDGEFGRDDGVSQEFTVHVNKVETD